MRVFISWSGTKSRAVAHALDEWLPRVIQSVDAFVSSEDIYTGNRWQQEIASQLGASSFGVICVTRENQSTAWLNFEAGALSKVVNASRVAPLAIDLAKADIRQPLGQFQAQEADKSGVRKLVESINDASEAPLAPEILADSFEQRWPWLADELKQIAAEAEPATRPERGEREILEEVLEVVRGLGRVAGPEGATIPDMFVELKDLLPGPATLAYTAGTNTITAHTRFDLAPEVREALERWALGQGYALVVLPDGAP